MMPCSGFGESQRSIKLVSNAAWRWLMGRFLDVTFVSQADEDEQLAAIEQLARRLEEPAEPKPQLSQELSSGL